MNNEPTPAKVRLTDGLGPLVAKLRDPSRATCWGTADNLMNEAADMLEACRAVGIRQEQIIMDQERETARLRGEHAVMARLLIEADKLLGTIEGECQEEWDMLSELRRAIMAATIPHRPEEADLLSLRTRIGA